MQLFNWQKKSRRELFMYALTTVLIIMLAAHPELRLFLPLIDAVGLDLMLLFVCAQALDYFRPFALIALHKILKPLAAKLYRLVLFCFGWMAPYVEARVAAHYDARNIAR